MVNDHYGLSGRPFQLTPDPRFYFESSTHKKAMAYLATALPKARALSW
jgi:general secretion pathway protein A